MNFCRSESGPSVGRLVWQTHCKDNGTAGEGWDLVARSVPQGGTFLQGFQTHCCSLRGGFDPHLGERFKLRLPIIFTSVRTGFWIRPVPRLWVRARAAPGDEVPAGELGWAAVLPRACLSLEPGNKEQLGMQPPGCKAGPAWMLMGWLPPGR